MSNEIELHQDAATLTLNAQMDFARAVTTQPERAAKSLLPDAYRGNPGNVLLAVGLGQAMGLSPAESLWRIDVIQGKPAAAAELIASNVRKAGHKLRVSVTEDPPSATCTIVRADDPEAPTTITRDMAWAQRMGLTGKDNYKKQPSTMLSWRAISACARLACPEALYGVSHTPDELYDSGAVRVEQTSGLAAALDPQTSGAGAAPGEAVAAPVEQPPASAPEPETGEVITKAQLTKLKTVLGNLGMNRDEGLSFYESTIGRRVESSKELTKAEAMRVIDALEGIEEQPFPNEPVDGEIVDDPGADQ